MRIPVYVVTGFLGAGKTSFVNRLFEREPWRSAGLLFLQFETGEADFQNPNPAWRQLAFPKKLLDRQPEAIPEQIRGCVQNMARRPDEIWVEWNGVTPFSKLQSIFLHPALRELVMLRRVIHLADGGNPMLGKTGGALAEQIVSSDVALVRGVPSPDALRKIRRQFSALNPGLNVREVNDYEKLPPAVFKRAENPMLLFAAGGLALLLLFLAARPLLELAGIPVNAILNVFLGILLQAVPYLLIGILLSSAIQLLVPQEWIERRFPKSLGAGMLVGILGGFCLPVCDCASIPIFRSLVRKGIPLPVAITFITASPVINPVVIFSTYQAFGGDWGMVAARVGLGVAASACIGLLFALRPSKDSVLAGGAMDAMGCNCGCYMGDVPASAWGKAMLFLRHSQAEFFGVGKYLVIGSLVAAAVQTLGIGLFQSAPGGANMALSILTRMGMAFALSLCSSSDAVIGRSFSNQFPMAAILGFLVFGPMMDIKNVLLLSSGFTKRFIARLLLTAFTVCFVLVYLVYGIRGG